ncbi:protein DpdD [Kribbella sp. NPDC051718]|uniref:protein DpdD n=1 Tax=Kribbella sp. NPDC051718 TaxID=3155168 RepID=UPI003443C1CF
MSVLDEFFGPGNELHLPSLDAALRAVVENWQHDIAAGDQTGFLPRTINGRLYWYGFTPNARRRREMLDLLDAWIGPTYSDLGQRHGALYLDDPFDIPLSGLACEPIRFEVLPRMMPGSKLAKERVRDALIILSSLLRRRPPSEFDAPRTTVEVLDDLGHAIAAYDRDLAMACLRELETTADLDESNLAFLRLRVLAGLRDWAELLSDRALEDVLAMRRPLGVTRIIQQAVYHTRFATLDREGGEYNLRGAVDELPQQFRGLASGAPTTSRAEAVVEFLIALQHSTDPSDPTLARILLDVDPESGPHADLKQLLDRGSSVALKGDISREREQESGGGPTKSSEQQLAALWVAGEYMAAIDLGCRLEPSMQVARTLLASARYLQSAESAVMVEDFVTRHDLKSTISTAGAAFRDDLAWLESFCAPASAGGWRAWFDGLGQAKHDGATNAPPYEVAIGWTPLDLAEFRALLFDADEAVLGQLGDCGGQFMAAHHHLLRTPESSTLTERILAGFALSHNTSAGVRVLTLAMLETLSPASPTAATFASILDWTAEIVDDCASPTAASWGVDVLQAATVAPAPDSASAMQGFFYRVVDALRPYRTALDLPDLAALNIVAEELGVAVPVELLAERSDEVDPGAPYRYLQGHVVALYSLTESAITRAAQVLRKLLPGIDVRTNSEHDGSAQLAALSANADTFVVVTASAKHAATDFITAHRGGRPTVLVNSRGSSAILRELAKA